MPSKDYNFIRVECVEPIFCYVAKIRSRCFNRCGILVAGVGGILLPFNFTRLKIDLIIYDINMH